MIWKILLGVCCLVLCLGSTVNGALGPFSLGATGDIELGNDPSLGPDGQSNGSGIGMRDIPDRRRVALISYDISALLDSGESFADVSFSHFSHDQTDEVTVYGVLEDLDLLDVETLTWNTAPGVQNDPTPPSNDPVALDLADLTDVLMTFIPPEWTGSGVRFSTSTSTALADFLNGDSDGIITFLMAASAVDTQAILRTRTHSSGGSLLEGQIVPEPATLALLGLGGVVLLRRRRTK